MKHVSIEIEDAVSSVGNVSKKQHTAMRLLGIMMLALLANYSFVFFMQSNINAIPSFKFNKSTCVSYAIKTANINRFVRKIMYK